MSPPVIALTVAFGAFATAAQVILLRELLVVLSGNELSVAVALAAWLAGVAAGAAAGGLATRWTRRAEGLAAISVGLAVALLPLGLLVVRLARALLGLEAGGVVPAPQALGVALAALAPVSFGVGLSFAPLVNVAGAGEGAAAPASRVYALEALGAVAGGLLVTLVLAGRIPHLVTAGLGGAAVLGAAAWMLASRRARLGAASFLALSLGLALASGAGALGALDEWSAERRFEALGAAGVRVASLESAYQHLDLALADGQYDLYADGSPLLSFPDPWERPGPVHVAMTQSVEPPRRVALVGGGVADRLAAALAHGPERVDVVELDPAELAIVRPVLPRRDLEALADPRVRLVHADGRRFLARAAAASYDLIVIEAPEPVTARANRYYTRELVASCRRALAPRGVLAIGVGGVVNYAAGEAGAPAAALLASLEAVFAEVAIWPGQAVRFFASGAPGVVTESEAELARRFASRVPDLEGWSEHRFAGLLPEDAVAATREALGRSETLPNTDARPIAYLYGLVLWDQRSRGADEPSPLWALRRVRLSWLLGPLAALALALLVLPRGRRAPARDGVVAVLTGGLFGLALEVVLLLAYQNVAGSLYRGLGLLVAVFMAGLAAGTLLASRAVSGRGLARVRRVAIAVDLATVAAALSVLLVPLAGDLGGLAAGVGLALAGLCTGATFPPAVALIEAGTASGRRGAAAALADAADHLGACVGALLVALIVLPVAGLLGAALVLAALKVSSLVGHLRGLSARLAERPGA